MNGLTCGIDLDHIIVIRSTYIMESLVRTLFGATLLQAVFRTLLGFILKRKGNLNPSATKVTTTMFKLTILLSVFVSAILVYAL